MKSSRKDFTIYGFTFFFYLITTWIIQIGAEDIRHNLPDNLEIIDPKSLGLSSTDLEKFLGNVKVLPIEGSFGGGGGLPKTQILTVGFDGNEQLNLQDFESISTAGLPDADKEVAELAFKKFQTFFQNPQVAKDFDEAIRSNSFGGSLGSGGSAVYPVVGGASTHGSNSVSTFVTSTPSTASRDGGLNKVKHRKRLRHGKQPLYSSTYRSIPDSPEMTTQRYNFAQVSPSSTQNFANPEPQQYIQQYYDPAPVQYQDPQPVQHQLHHLQYQNSEPAQHQLHHLQFQNPNPTSHAQHEQFQYLNQVFPFDARSISKQEQSTDPYLLSNYGGSNYMPPAPVPHTQAPQSFNSIAHQENLAESPVTFETEVGNGGQQFETTPHQDKILLKETNQNALRAPQTHQHLQQHTHHYPYVAKQHQFMLRPSPSGRPFPSVKPHNRNPQLQINTPQQQNPPPQHEQQPMTVEQQQYVASGNQQTNHGNFIYKINHEHHQNQPEQLHPNQQIHMNHQILETNLQKPYFLNHQISETNSQELDQNFVNQAPNFKHHRQQKQITATLSPHNNHQEAGRIILPEAGNQHHQNFQKQATQNPSFTSQDQNFNKIQQHRFQNMNQFVNTGIRPSQVDPLQSDVRNQGDQGLSSQGQGNQGLSSQGQGNQGLSSQGQGIQTYKNPKQPTDGQKTQHQEQKQRIAAPSDRFNHHAHSNHIYPFPQSPTAITPKSISMSGVIQITPSTPLIPLSTVENAMTAHKTLMQMLHTSNTNAIPEKQLEITKNQIPGSSDGNQIAGHKDHTIQPNVKSQQNQQFGAYQRNEYQKIPANKRPISAQAIPVHSPHRLNQRRPFPHHPHPPPHFRQDSIPGPPPPPHFRQDPIPGLPPPQSQSSPPHPPPHFIPEPMRYMSAPLPPPQEEFSRFAQHSTPFNQIPGQGHPFRGQKSLGPVMFFQGSRNMPPHLLSQESQARPPIPHPPPPGFSAPPLNPRTNQRRPEQELRLHFPPPPPQHIQFVPQLNSRFPNSMEQQQEDPYFHREANDYATSLGVNIQSINSAPLIGSFVA